MGEWLRRLDLFADSRLYREVHFGPKLILTALSDQLDRTCKTHNQTASGCELTPLGQGGGSGLFENTASVEMAFVVEVVVDRSMDGGEFLQGLDVSEPRHRPFPSSERLVRVLGPVVEPTTAGPGVRITNHRQRHPIGPKPVRDDRSRPAIAFHRAPRKLKRSPAIPPFRGQDLEHFSFVVNRAPQIAALPVDPHEHLIKVPASDRIPMMMNPALADLRSKQRTEPVPPVAHGLVADVDAGLPPFYVPVPMLVLARFLGRADPAVAHQ